jgi:hypothetical protein
MFALGAYLLVSVASATPVGPVHVAEQLASTYEEATCDASDSGECAEEVELSIPTPAAILDCENPLIQEMIGSCDLPKPAPPTAAHAPTLRNSNGVTAVVRTADGSDHLTIVSAPPGVDAALPTRGANLSVFAAASRYLDSAYIAQGATLQYRLDRPPRV